MYYKFSKIYDNEKISKAYKYWCDMLVENINPKDDFLDCYRFETGEIEKVKKKMESNWNFSIYNLYARENAYSLNFREKESDPTQTEIIQVSLFKMIPSISYNFKF